MTITKESRILATKKATPDMVEGFDFGDLEDVNSGLIVAWSPDLQGSEQIHYTVYEWVEGIPEPIIRHEHSLTADEVLDRVVIELPSLHYSIEWKLTGATERRGLIFSAVLQHN